MGWLEDREKENADRINAKNPQVGDFVNLNTWFGDIWAEVLMVFPPSDGGGRGSMVIAYHRDRNTTEYIFYYMVRKIVKRDTLTMKDASRIYIKDGTFTDAFSRNHGRPLEEFFGGFRASMRYRILNQKGAPVAEAKRLDTIKNLRRQLKDRELLRLRDIKTRMYMDWNDCL